MNTKRSRAYRNAEDMDKASGWFRDLRFKAAADWSGCVSRQIWFATGKQRV